MTDIAVSALKGDNRRRLTFSAVLRVGIESHSAGEALVCVEDAEADGGRDAVARGAFTVFPARLSF